MNIDGKNDLINKLSKAIEPDIIENASMNWKMNWNLEETPIKQACIENASNEGSE